MISLITITNNNISEATNYTCRNKNEFPVTCFFNLNMSKQSQ